MGGMMSVGQARALGVVEFANTVVRNGSFDVSDAGKRKLIAEYFEQRHKVSGADLKDFEATIFGNKLKGTVWQGMNKQARRVLDEHRCDPKALCSQGGADKVTYVGSWAQVSAWRAIAMTRATEVDGFDCRPEGRHLIKTEYMRIRSDLKNFTATGDSEFTYIVLSSISAGARAALGDCVQLYYPAY